MKEISIIGVDLAKNVFQLHSATADRTVLFRKTLSRLQFGLFIGDYPACEVKIETCLGAHQKKANYRVRTVLAHINQ